MLAKSLRCLLSVTLVGALGATALAGPPAAPVHTPHPYAGYYNHAHAAPAFQWGWFGAQQHYPQTQWARDYNGELVRWNVNRRY